MIRLKTLLEQATADAAKPKAKVTPIRAAIAGGIQKVLGFFKQRGSRIEITDIPIDSYLQKYKYDERKIVTNVEGRTYLHTASTQKNNVEAETTNSFISICRQTATQSDLPSFKRIGYLVTFESNDEFFEYFLMEYYTGNSVTDSIGQCSDNSGVTQSVNTLEGKSGKLTQPAGFAEAVQKAFPNNWAEIRNDLSSLTGLYINAVTEPSNDRTDYL